MMRKKSRGIHEKQIRSMRVLSPIRALLATEFQFESNRHLLRKSQREVTFTLLHPDRFSFNNPKRSSRGRVFQLTGDLTGKFLDFASNKI
jgi:hypothetical protein